jgi:hypothetical protein
MLALRAPDGIFRAWVAGRAAAVLTAVSLGLLAHETFGIARAEIRIDALGGAALLAIVWCASYFREPPR